jgi:hypothetical protein
MVFGVKLNCPEPLGFMSPLDGSTSAPVSIISSCFVSVGFCNFIVLLAFRINLRGGLDAPLLPLIQLYTPSFTSFVDNWIAFEVVLPSLPLAANANCLGSQFRMPESHKLDRTNADNTNVRIPIKFLFSIVK